MLQLRTQAAAHLDALDEAFERLGLQPHEVSALLRARDLVSQSNEMAEEDLQDPVDPRDAFAGVVECLVEAAWEEVENEVERAKAHIQGL